MKGLDREKSLAKDAYYSEHYFSYGQLWSFVEQIHHINGFQPEQMIEVGVGNGLVSTFFRSMGVGVKTFDINPNLNPDVVASVQDLDKFVKPKDYELIVCCEVLEHMPFANFEQTIQMFSHLSNNLFLTLPIYGRTIGFGGLLKLPKFQQWIGLWLRLPLWKQSLPDMHFWEVNHDKHTRQSSILKILRSSYDKVESGLFKANPYHCYFKCINEEHK